jgi:hypothetical protein
MVFIGDYRKKHLLPPLLQLQNEGADVAVVEMPVDEADEVEVVRAEAALRAHQSLR